MTRASRVFLPVLGLLALAALSRPAIAQTRDQQIAQAQAAYDGFDPPRALTLLKAALDPTRGPQDATWARGVQLLAQILVEDQKTPLATTWLRWAIRLSPNMPIDTVAFLPEVVAAARAARAAVIGSADTVSRTTWQWAAPGFSDAEGGLRVSSRTGTPVQVLVEGTGLVTAGQAMRLPPGTYNLQASSNGFVTSRVSREVLPGTVSSVEFNLVSVVAAQRAAADTLLAQPVLDAAVRRVAMIQPERFGLDPAASCASGFVVGSGLVATSYRAIRGGDRVTIDLGGGRRVTDVRVAAYSIASDVAFLAVPTALTDSIPIGASTPQGPAYAVGFGDCRAVTSRRTILTPNAARPDALGSGTRLAEGFRGAPLVDRAGTVLGVMAGPDSALAVSRVVTVLAEARRVVAARGTLSTPAEVATREKHSFGSMTVRSGVSGAVIRVSPAETWQWPELAREGPAPFTFAGPAGRYNVTLVVAGAIRQSATATVTAGVRGQMNVDPLVAGGTPVGGQTGILPPKKKSKMPFIIAGGGAAAGAILFVALGGGGGAAADTGSIRVLVPVNP